MADDELFTGVFTFPDPRDPEKKQFGMVGCASTGDTPGSVTLFLRHRDTGIAYEVDDASVKLVIPEDMARTLLPIVQRALDRIEELRRNPKAE